MSTKAMESDHKERRRWEDLLTDREFENREDYLRGARDESRLNMKWAVIGGSLYTKGTGLTEKNPHVTQDDVTRVTEMLYALQPISGKDTDGLLQHLILTGEFAKRIAEEVNAKIGKRFNPHAMQIRGLIHDIGRLIGQQRYARHEWEGAALVKRLELPRNWAAISDLGKDFKPLHRLSSEEKLLMLADICGKRNADGSIRPFEKTMENHHASRKNPGSYLATFEIKQALFASELSGLKTMETDVGPYGKLYEELKKWFLALGVDIEKIRFDIEKEEQAAK